MPLISHQQRYRQARQAVTTTSMTPQPASAPLTHAQLTHAPVPLKLGGVLVHLPPQGVLVQAAAGAAAAHQAAQRPEHAAAGAAQHSHTRLVGLWDRALRGGEGGGQAGPASGHCTASCVHTVHSLRWLH